MEGKWRGGTRESVCMLRLRAPIVEILCVHPGHVLPMWENISSFMLLLSDKYMPVALCLSSLTSKCALYGEKKYILIMFWIDFIDIWECNLSTNYTRVSQCYYSYLIFLTLRIFQPDSQTNIWADLQLPGAEANPMFCPKEKVQNPGTQK